jgi:hypothetical protein
VYPAYIAKSQILVGIYRQSYGWVAPGELVSRPEDEYRLSAGLPRLTYVKSPAADRKPRLPETLARIQDEGDLSYQHFSDSAELARNTSGTALRSVKSGDASCVEAPVDD